MGAISYLTKPILENNPISVQILGLCSALAITQSLFPALIMATAVTCVLSFSNVVISSLRHLLPSSIRLILEMTIIASAVIVVDEIIKIVAPEISQILSVFVGLIVTNCVVLGRAEGFALIHNMKLSLLDAIGNGLGYSFLIILIAIIRELFGRGTLLGKVIFTPSSEGGWFLENQFMSLPSSAFFILGIFVWVVNSQTVNSQASKRTSDRNV